MMSEHISYRRWNAKGHVSLVVSQCWVCLFCINTHTHTLKDRSTVEEVWHDPAALTATNLVIQLFPDTDSNLRHCVWYALTQIQKQHTKTKAPQMTSKPLRGTNTQGCMCVDELITDVYVCTGVCCIHTPRQLLSSQELPSVRVWQLSDTSVSIPKPCVSQTPLRCGYSSRAVCLCQISLTHTATTVTEQEQK